eukprot:gene1144-biopygen3712
MRRAAPVRHGAARAGYRARGPQPRAEDAEQGKSLEAPILAAVAPNSALLHDGALCLLAQCAPSTSYSDVGVLEGQHPPGDASDVALCIPHVVSVDLHPIYLITHQWIHTCSFGCALTT